MSRTNSILDTINQPHHWGFAELKASAMGDNFFECVLIYRPEYCPCQFAGYLHVEFDGEAEQLVKNYGNPVNVQKFLQDNGQVVFVPKLHDEDRIDDLSESNLWDEFHLDHNEDFISPYSHEVNGAIINRMIELYKSGQNLKAFGMNQDLVDFLTLPHHEQEVGSEDELMMALSPFRNSVNKLIEAPQFSSINMKLMEDNKIALDFNLDVLTVYKDEDCLQLCCSVIASIDQKSKTLVIESIKEVEALVLGYNDDEEDFLIYGVSQWFEDYYSELKFNGIFDLETYQSKLKSIVGSSVVSEALAKAVFA